MAPAASVVEAILFGAFHGARAGRFQDSGCLEREQQENRELQTQSFKKAPNFKLKATQRQAEASPVPGQNLPPFGTQDTNLPAEMPGFARLSEDSNSRH